MRIQLDPLHLASQPPGAPQAAYPSLLRAWYSVVLLAALYFISYADRASLRLLVTPIQKEFGISDVEFGFLIGTTFAIMYVVFGLLLSPLADRYNRKWLIIAGGLTWTVSTVLSAFAGKYSHLLVLRVGLAIGEAALTPAAISMIGDLFPRERRAAPTSLYTSAGAAGATGAFLLAALLLRFLAGSEGAWAIAALQTPWRAALFWVGVPGVFMVLLFGATVREPARREALPQAAQAGQPEAGAPTADRRLLTGLIVAFTLFAYVPHGFFSWYSTILVRSHQLAVADAGSWFGSIGVIAMGAGVLSAPLLLRAAGRLWAARAENRLFLAALLLLMPLVLAALNGRSLVLALVGLAPTMFLVGLIAVLPFVAIQLHAPDRLRARLAALMIMLSNIFGMGLSPLVTGLLAKVPGIDGLGRALAAGSLVALFLAVCVLWLEGRRDAGQRVLPPASMRAVR